MYVIPRGRHAWEGISVNAMGFAGSFLVPNAGALQKLRELGPRRVLSGVSRLV